MAAGEAFVESGLRDAAERTVQREPASPGHASAGNGRVKVTFRTWLFPPAAAS